MATFGHVLRRERKLAGLSQESLAELAEMDRGHLSKIENGRIGVPSLAVVTRLAGPLGTTADELYAKAGIRPDHWDADAIDDDAVARVVALIRSWTPDERRAVLEFFTNVTAVLDERDPPVDDDDGDDQPAREIA